MDIISIARIESGSSLFLHIRNKSGLLFNLHMVYMSKALEIIQLVIARNVTMIQLCDFFFFFITGSYSSRRGCFVWLTQKDTTICVQTYSELCLLIKRKKNLSLMNTAFEMQTLFLQKNDRGVNENIFDFWTLNFEMFEN